MKRGWERDLLMLLLGALIGMLLAWIALDLGRYQTRVERQMQTR